MRFPVSFDMLDQLFVLFGGILMMMMIPLQKVLKLC